MNSSCEELCSCLFVRKSNNKRYKHLKEKQHNAFLMGDNKYTKKIVEAKNLIQDWQVPTSMHQALIANKEEEGGAASVEQGKTAAVRKDPKGKFHG